MPSTYGMRAVPLGPSYDLVVAGKSGMDGLWSAAHIFMSLAGKGLMRATVPVGVGGGMGGFLVLGRLVLGDLWALCIPCACK